MTGLPILSPTPSPEICPSTWRITLVYREHAVDRTPRRLFHPGLAVFRVLAPSPGHAVDEAIDWFERENRHCSLPGGRELMQVAVESECAIDRIEEAERC